MRMARGTVGVACALLVCATLVACGDDSGSSDSGGESSASDNAITVKASEYKFDISGQLTAGYSQITFENDGKQPHELISAKLKDGKTAADALPILEAEGEPDPAALAEVFDGDPTTAFYGTPGPLAPTDHQTTVANFTQGSYVFVCFLPSPDGKSHVSLGMLSEVTIGAGDNTTAPETKGTFTITDDSITVPDGVSSGTYAVTNSGEQPSSSRPPARPTSLSPTSTLRSTPTSPRSARVRRRSSSSPRPSPVASATSSRREALGTSSSTSRRATTSSRATPTTTATHSCRRSSTSADATTRHLVTIGLRNT